jgi:DNA-binding PadR family transcriptional regulator
MALSDVLVGLLLDEPDHGYCLKRRLSPGLPEERLINDGILYPLLKRLERDGLLSSRSERRAGRDRRSFRATARGRRAFLTWLRSDRDEDDQPTYALYVDHPLVKLLFSDHLSDSERLAKLTNHSRGVRERLATLERLRAIMDPRGARALSSAWLELEIAQQEQRLVGLQALLDQVGASAAPKPEETVCSG